MPASVTLDITINGSETESFTYTEKESLILGRADDCSIILAEPTVSRYHCMVEILPPSANFRDFGSGNGIRLNGKTVVAGRFKTGQSIDETQEGEATEFALKDGDVIALSSKCEISVKLFVPEYCAECLTELGQGEEDRYQNGEGENICPECYVLYEEIKEKEAEQKKQEEEGRKRAAEEARLAELKKQEEDERKEKDRLAELRRDAIRDMRDEKTKCMICEAFLPEGRAADDGRICPRCRANPIAVLEYMLRMAAENQEGASEIKGYRKISELGRGGMGAVFKVEEEATGDIFALKMILASKQANANARAQFLREASIGRQLDHPHILKHYKYGSSGDAFFVLQEICEGGSVDKLIENRGGRLPVDLATDITLQVLDALTYAHTKQIEVDLADGTVGKYIGIVHRDIKPGNFFLADKSPRPTAKLADFGMAKSFEAAGLTDFTRTGDAGGTPVFMPRQQIINYKYAKPDVDVWAVAASYYFMLTGFFPKDFIPNKDIWSQALKNPAVPIRKRDRQIDKKLAEVVDHALIEKPSIGYSSAEQFKKAIEGAL